MSCVQNFIDRGVALREITDGKGNTLLHQATAKGKPAVARLLIENGLDPKSLNDFGKSSIGIAEDYKSYGKGYRETFLFLSKEGNALAAEVAAKIKAEGPLTGKRKREEDATAEGSEGARVNSERMALLGKRVTKEFPGFGYYEGVVTCDEGENGLMVVYDDKTIEYLPVEEVRIPPLFFRSQFSAAGAHRKSCQRVFVSVYV